MSYTLRQVQPLLTKPELELFNASRAGAVKELSERQLAAKITRARALRDKYRDTYRRQTVATRGQPAAKRAPKGGENARTETKAEIMAEVLARFEAQQTKLQAKAAKQPKASPRVPTAPGAPATKTKPKAAQRSRRSSGNAAPGEGADLAMRGATTMGRRQVQRKERAATAQGLDVVAARGAKSTRAGTAKKAAPAKKATAKKVGAKKLPAAKAITGAKQPAATLLKGVKKAVAKKSSASAAPASSSRARGGKTLVGGSASDNAQGAVPTNMPAKAQRMNPLKAKPVNKKIHASARSRGAQAQAKRDAR